MSKSKRSKEADSDRAEQEMLEEKIQMENEIKMLNIACESKNRAIEDLNLKVRFTLTIDLTFFLLESNQDKIT